jgi:biopolymer transport protein ExbD
MKKCSHSAHESLTELNITPLLDLAFVLLVIFIITTIPPVKDMDLKLPVASKNQKDPPPKAVYISVQADGNVYIDRESCLLADLQARLLAMREADEDLKFIIRGDAHTKYKQIRTVLDICQQVNILKVDLATEINNASK